MLYSAYIPALVVLLALAAPSLPSAHAAEAAPVSPANSLPGVASDYELRGFFGVGDDTEVSLRPVGTQNSRWYRLGKKTGGVLIEKADAKTGVAVIVVNGTRRTLRLSGETRAEATSAARQAGAELSRNYAGWTGAQRDAARLALKSSLDEILRTHPEYFEPTTSKTPEANAAIREMLLKYTEAGNAVANADGTFPHKIENLSDKIAMVHDKMEVRATTKEEQEEYAEQLKRSHGSPASLAQHDVPGPGFFVLNGDGASARSFTSTSDKLGVAVALGVIGEQAAQEAAHAPEDNK